MRASLFRKFILGTAATLLGVMVSGSYTHASTVYTTRDCDNNAIVRCGVADSSQMAKAYNQSGVAPVYNYFGISRQDISAAGSNMVTGRVTRDGKVYANGKLVATNAMTAGRQYMPGSKAETRGSMTFYVRPPSVSFKRQSLPAYVMMRNGQFSYAVIASCGNPVSAKPVKPKKKVVITPTVQKPQQTPPAAQTQTQTQTQTVTVTVPAPVVQAATTTRPTTTVTTVPATTTKAIPNTGPGSIAELAGSAVVAGTLFHYFVLRRLYGRRV